MNQVYFYTSKRAGERGYTELRLNPFMNQVYFYTRPARPSVLENVDSLNPFMNQVYFYRKWAFLKRKRTPLVLIPL